METTKEYLLKRIIGEIVLSDIPGEAMRRWREIFGISQLELAKKMKVSPSVISDYEGGRRKSPGSIFIKRYVSSLIEIDEEKGGKILERFSVISKSRSDAILDICEFSSPIVLEKLVKAVDGEFIVYEELSSKYILGYTVVDSIKAIMSMSGSDFIQLIGSTSERAIIFTNTSTGRSPMVAIRVAPIKPSAVILHGIRKLDKLAVELAKIERIPLIISKKENIKELIDSLHRI
ncbi:MAG: helix-turn-helix domain-containing protein [Candidatus Verstraetearchaeota archaeon]|nr:helix-turn-helix domain-containing protein [Candidatus Verstraetearchaeota archaeon]